MLWQRVATALVLLPVVLGAIAYAPTAWLFALFSVVGVLAAWEWAGLVPGASARGRFVYAAVTAVMLALAWLGRDFWPWFMGAALLWWCVAAWLLKGFPENLQGRLQPMPMFALGQVMVVPTILGTAILHGMPDGGWRLLYALSLVWVADTGAYFVGRALGRHKLAPKVSPGKSIEGAAGGLGAVVAWSLTAGVFAFKTEGAATALLLALSLAVACISIVGDLTESMFKRLAGVKDSGNLLPGHGGVLDRVDSLLAAVPTMALGVYVVGL